MVYFRHCYLTFVKSGGKRIKIGDILCVEGILDAEIIKSLAVYVIGSLQHLCHQLVFHVLELELGDHVIVVIKVVLLCIKLLEHIAENGDSRSYNGSKIAKILIYVKILVRAVLLCLCSYLLEVGRVVFVIGNTHCEKRADVVKCVGVTLHKDDCELLCGDVAGDEDITDALALEAGLILDAHGYNVIEVELTECDVGKIVACIVCIAEILNGGQVILAHRHVFCKALCDHLLVVTFLVTAVHLHYCDVGDGILDVRGRLVCEPHADLAGGIIEVSIEDLIALKLCICENIAGLLIILCVDYAKIAQINLLCLCSHRNNTAHEECEHEYCGKQTLKSFFHSTIS